MKNPAWLLPLGDIYYLDGQLHADVAKKFLLGLFEVDKTFHFQRAALQDKSTKYVDYEELDALVKEQLINWTIRGK